MSRCFPFPPQGYEKKARLDDPDLLNKEKRRERKHKKEKKDKEKKKERKEKEEKDRSDEKRREKKKAKKEKRRDRKKEKEKEKKKKDQNADKNKEINSESKSAVEQSHGYYDGEEAKASREKGKNKEKVNCIALLDGNRVSGAAGQSSSSVLGPVEFSHPLPGSKDYFKVVEQFGSWTANEGNIRPSKPFLDHPELRKDEEMASFAGNSKEKRVNGGEMDMGLAARPSPAEIGKSRVGGMGRPVEKIIEDMAGEKVASDKKAEKRKDREKSSKKDKEKKKKERVKENGEKQMELQPRIQDSSKSRPIGKTRVKEARLSDLLSVRSFSPQNHLLPNESSKNASVDDDCLLRGKRKEVGPDKVVPVDGVVGPNKKAKTSSSYTLTQNGRSREPYQTSNIVTFDVERTPNNVKVGKSSEVSQQVSNSSVKTEIIKEKRLNGTTIDVQSSSLRWHSPDTGFTDQNKEAQALRRPSPATAYASQNTQAQPMRWPSPATTFGDQNAGGGKPLRRPPPASAIADQDSEAKPMRAPTPAMVYADQRVETQPLPLPLPLRKPSPASLYADQKPEAQPLRKPSPAMVHADQIQKPEAQPSRNPSPAMVHADHQKPEAPPSRKKKPEAQPSRRPSPETLFVDQMAESSKRPEHPDAKQLSRVLSLPKMDELSESEDQEWLFGSITHSKNTSVVTSGYQETPQVWAKAVKIESADIIALPFVIPF
ncbi:hypothetical protein Dimus_029834 [Dionaea muscipula]